jgi:hypothetical protein
VDRSSAGRQLATCLTLLLDNILSAVFSTIINGLVGGHHGGAQAVVLHDDLQETRKKIPVTHFREISIW